MTCSGLIRDIPSLQQSTGVYNMNLTDKFFQPPFTLLLPSFPWAKSYYNLSSVTLFVCAPSPWPFMDLRAPNSAGGSGRGTKKTCACRIAHQQSYYNLTSVCAGESQGGNPIGKALVFINTTHYAGILVQIEGVLPSKCHAITHA